MCEFDGLDRTRMPSQPCCASPVAVVRDQAALAPLPNTLPHLGPLICRCLALCQHELLPPSRCPVSTLYSLMAFDLALDESGSPFVLEVNSHPAIADGTMSRVDPHVYTRLVADVTHLLVPPSMLKVDEVDDDAAHATNFERLEGAFASAPLNMECVPEVERPAEVVLDEPDITQGSG